MYAGAFALVPSHDARESVFLEKIVRGRQREVKDAGARAVISEC